MDHSRRDWALLLPALLATPALRAAERPKLASAVHKFEDLTPRPSETNIGRSVLDGLNRSGVQIEIHETALTPGGAPHPPHRHKHVELVLLRQGQLEVTIDGTVSTITPGSVAYFASNCLHGAKNTGSQAAQYFVISLDKDQQ